MTQIVTNDKKTGGALIAQYLNNKTTSGIIEKALGSQAGAFSASLIELYSSDKNLTECEPSKVLAEAMKAVALKLPIVKAMGFAYIVAFKGVPTLQIGYKGFIQLAMRTGEYKFLNAGEVYQGEYKCKDKLSGSYDLSGEKESDTIIGYFAHFETLNGFKKTLYWDLEAVTAHAKRYSKTFNVNNSPWKTEFDKMAIKTVLRNLLTHWGYLSIEMINTIESDRKSDEEESGDTIKAKANKTEIKTEFKVEPTEHVNEETGEVTEGIEF